MTDAGHTYLHPGYKKPYPVETVLRDLAAQEGCDGEPYDAMVFAATAITTLRAQLAEARAERDIWEIDAKRNHQAAEIEFARAEQAEAALAAQIEADAEIADYYADQDYCAMGYPEEGGIAASGTADMIRREIRNQPRAGAAEHGPYDRTAQEVMHEDAPAAIIGEIGNQIHNLGCELQNDEDVSLRLSDLACRLWDAAKLFPTEPTALDRMLADAREKALREAVEILDDEIDLARIAMPQAVPILAADRNAILALIEKPNAR